MGRKKDGLKKKIEFLRVQLTKLVNIIALSASEFHNLYLIANRVNYTKIFRNHYEIILF